MSGGGDTPIPNTLVKFEDPNNPNKFVAGEITNEDTQTYRKGQLLIYAQAGGAALIGFDSTGKWVSSNSNPAIPGLFLNACNEAGYELTNSQLILPDWQIGHEIENWSEYVQV